MTKGGVISSASPLVIDVDGNYFDVTGNTNFAAMTVESGNFFMLQFDGVLTITHGSGIELPGAANLTTAAGDRLICYATAANTVEVMSVETEAAASTGGYEFVEKVTISSASVATFSHVVAAGYDYFLSATGIDNDGDISAANTWIIQYGTGGSPTFQTSGYVSQASKLAATASSGVRSFVTTGLPLWTNSVCGGATGELWGFEAIIFNPAANAKTKGHVTTGFDQDGGLLELQILAGYRTTAEVVTALRVIAGSGAVTGDFLMHRRSIT